MSTTITCYTAPSAGFVRGIAALDPDTLIAHTEDLRFLAGLTCDEHPASSTARALLRGVELLVRKVHEDADLPVPDDIPAISPELRHA
ncbi:hypothetical protein FHX42_005249 [Saccharopolyspora lacisalsi]|uniref:Uncharacterized protein n=1 Tax=Halosaccharopolyspora lacisalsi TaxID=1000566 RepID=A0A839E0W8_9PSEU|nr:hypothetical protein [Halosaccharopolyspora lacisalsi]MBA8827842.1 hypothetical protein [Halosaccharopolyspora lacisalsi]